MSTNSPSQSKGRVSGVIAIAGRPNVGKSTLMNRILGTEISIVTHKAQTTRERVHGILNEAEGQMVFIDTPGIHFAKEGGLNEAMVFEAEQALDEPDQVWYLIDPWSELKREKAVIERIRAAKAPVWLLLNKWDTVKGDEAKAAVESVVQEVKALLIAEGITVADVREISAETGKGLKRLLEDMWKRLPKGEPLFPNDDDAVSDRPMRYFVAEKVREQLLLQLEDELPYGCAVRLDRFDESKKPFMIVATVIVERDSQKGMVIGAGGKKIKAIGQIARKNIEELVGEKVYLDLKVEVMKHWTRNAARLKELGYLLPPKRKGTTK